MEMKIDKNIYLKLIAVLLCIYIAFLPFFQPKKVYANPLIIAGACVASLLIGMKVCGYVEKVVVSAEKLNELNEQATANLQSAFPDPTEYNKQLGILENLSNDLLSGKDVDWSKYSGKAIYAISKAVIDVLYPNCNSDTGTPPEGSTEYYYLGQVKGKHYYYGTSVTNSVYLKGVAPYVVNALKTRELKTYISGSVYWEYYLRVPDNLKSALSGEYTGGMLYATETYGLSGCADFSANTSTQNPDGSNGVLIWSTSYPTASALNFFCNPLAYADIPAKTTTKIKLPTRLPPSVINNYNTYINGESENLVIDPTDDELPQLPDNYNPVTDDPPDLDGFQDVTPDQEPTDTPEPTPSPDYDGSSWIKPIGDFFAGLLSFLKDALIPTQTVDFSPLQNMSTDFGSKFPFSLPGDIGKLFGVLQAEPRRPEFHMIFDLSKVGVPGEPIVWDLNFEQWDDAAAIVKTALYIGFLIGLVFISKNFMKN
ncbi:hypothetical protein ACH52_3662 [Eubacterium limosum]|nr:hypothetical protein ACH52_3662 [Eubacterium limosum]